MKTKRILKKRFLVAVLALLCLLTLSFAFAFLPTRKLNAAESTQSSEGMTFSSGVDGMYITRKTSTEAIRTFEATVWFNETRTNSTTTVSTAKGGVILGNYTGGTPSVMKLEVVENGSPNLCIVDESSVKHDFTFSSVTLYNGNKTHLAVVLDDDGAKCYIDGVLKETIAYKAAMPLVAMGSSITVGGDKTSGNWDYFQGTMYDVALYSDARTATEVKADTSDYGSDHLLLRYDLSVSKDEAGNDIVETTIADLSGNGFDLIRQTTWVETSSVSDYAYSFALVGDPQMMNNFKHDTYNTDAYHAGFSGIFDYIVSNQSAKNIQEVMVMGDITDDNATEEWANAVTEFKKLDNAGMSYTVLRGNHDGYTSGGNVVADTTRFDTYFTSQIDYASQLQGYYTENNSSTVNAYKIITVGDVKYLIVTLDYGPSDAVLNWANGIIAANLDCNVIVATHAYLLPNGTTDISSATEMPSTLTGGNDGADIWNKLIRKHKNIVMVVGGHNSSNQVVVTQSKGDYGNTVTQMLINHQDLDASADMQEYGGTGMVTMMYFSADGKNVQVECYSTTKEQYYLASNQMTLELDTVTTQYTPVMIDGASVRYVAPSGIRFSAYVDEQTANAQSGYTYGFLVAVNDGNVGELTADNAKAQKLVCLDWALDSDDYDKDGYKLYHAAITKLPEAYYGAEFIARAFVQSADGTYYYSDVVTTRSIAQVANSAVADSTFMDKLTEEQEGWVKDYVDTVVEGTSFTLQTTSMTFSQLGSTQAISTTYSGTVPLVYSSNNTSVATVDSDGIVRAVGVGSATITVRLGSTQSATVSVTVSGTTGQSVTAFISTATELKSILSGSGYYVLTNDIDLGVFRPEGAGFTDTTPTNALAVVGANFSGTLDGNGYTITYTTANQNGVYLFAEIVSGATVKNLVLDVTCYAATNVRQASLAYRNSGTIDNVYVKMTGDQPGQNGGDNGIYSKAGLVIQNCGTIQNTVVEIHYTGSTKVDLGNTLYSWFGITARSRSGSSIKNTALITIISDSSVGSIGAYYENDAKGSTSNLKTYTSLAAFASGYSSFVSSGYSGTHYPTVIDLDAVDYAWNESSASASSWTVSGITGTVSGVSYNGTNVSYSTGSGSVTIAGSVMSGLALGYSENEFTITTSAFTYKAKANVTSKSYTVSSASEFLAIESDPSGNYVLTADIDLGSISGTAAISLFNGTLDGNGYTVNYTSGAHYTQLFGEIGASGTVKNLKLSVDVSSHTGQPAANYALAKYNRGAIENVCSQVTFNNSANAPASTNFSSGGLVAANYGTINNAVAELIYVGSATASTIVGWHGVAYNNEGTITNSAAISNGLALSNASGEQSAIYKQQNDGTNTNVTVYEDVEAFTLYLADFQSAGYSGTNYPTSTCVILNSLTYEYSDFDIPALTISGIEGTVTGVKGGGSSLGYTDNGGSVTIATDSIALLSVGNNTVRITTSTNTYVVKVFVTKILSVSTAEEFMAIADNPSGKYILAADIDLGTFEAGTLAASTTVASSFGGTLDGNGYTVSYTSSGNFVQLFGTIAAGATVKNLNLVVDTTAQNGQPAANYALAKYNYGTIENVYSQVTFKNNGNAATSTDYSSGGLVAVNEGAINNVVVELIYTGSADASTVTGWHGVAYDGNGKISNAAVISSLGIAVNYKGYGTMTNTASYTSVAAFATDTTFWAGYTGTNYPSTATLDSDSYEYFVDEPAAYELGNIIGNVTGVQFNGADLTYSLSNNTLTISADSMQSLTAYENNEITITTDKFTYTISIYKTMKYTVSDSAGFLAIADDLNGYYVLAADIDLGEYNDGTSVNFAGVLDGNDYKITYSTDNTHNKALFGTMSGTVKNLNVSISTYAGNQVNIAAIAATNTGVIENVCVEYAASVAGQGINASLAKAGIVMTNSGTINNAIVVMNYTGDTSANILGFCAVNSSGATISNSALINLGTVVSEQTTNNGTKTNVKSYTSVEAFAADTTFWAGYTGTNYPSITHISTADQFKAIESGATGYYVLDNDIDLGAYNVGTGVNFAGILDGNGYKISYSTGAAHDKALFGTMSGTVKNLNVSISVYAGNQVRIAAIAATNTGVIENVCVEYAASVAGQANNATNAKAGIVMTNSGTINNAIVLMNYTGDTSANILGFCAVNSSGATISNSALINLATVVSEQTTNSGTKTNVKSYTSIAAFATDTTFWAGYTGTNYPSTATLDSDSYEYFVDEPAAYEIGTIVGNLTSVQCNGADLTYSWSNNTLTISADSMQSLTAYANNEITITTDKFTYTISIYKTMKYRIDTVAEFQAIEDDMKGYYVLASDLSLYGGGGTASNYRWNTPLGATTANSTTANTAFTGTLDGNGYTLTYVYSWGGFGSNNHDKSLFYIIGETGVVKNLGLNVTEGTGGAMARSAALAWINNGTVENVYVKIKFTHNASGQNEEYGSAGLVANNYGTIDNCVVDFTDTTTSGTAVAAVVSINNSGATISNTVAIVTSSNSGTVYQNVNNGTKTNTPLYTSMADFVVAFDAFKAADYKGTYIASYASIAEAFTVSDLSGTVTKVTMNGTDITSACTLDSGTVTISADTMATLTVGNTVTFVVRTDTTSYTVSAVIITSFITTVAEFQAIEDDMTGYYVLANDLSIYNGTGTSSNSRWNIGLGLTTAASNNVYDESAQTLFTGTLDGNGYTLTYEYAWRSASSPIANANGDAFLFFGIGETGVIKNLGLNVKASTHTCRTAALAYVNRGTVENVYVQFNMSSSASGTNASWGVAGIAVNNYGVINNCVVDMKWTGSGTAPLAVVVINNSGATISNTAAISTGTSTVSTYQTLNNGTKTNTPLYTSYADFYAALDSFVSSGFDKGVMWTIDESAITFGK